MATTPAMIRTMPTITRGFMGPSSACQVPAVAGVADELPITRDHPAAGDRRDGPAAQAPPLPQRVVGVRLEVLPADLALEVEVHDGEVGVAPHPDRPLARVEVE